MTTTNETRAPVCMERPAYCTRFICGPVALCRECDGEVGCKGHPAGPFDPMGKAVFCDGSCAGPSVLLADPREAQR